MLFSFLLSPPVTFCLTFSTVLLIPFSQQKRQTSNWWQMYIKNKTSCTLIVSSPSLSSYLSSMRTQRSLKCRCRCFFCLFLLFFFSILLSAFSSSSRLSGGRSMWGNRSSSRGRPSSSSLWGSSWRKGSRRGDSSWCSSDSGEAGLDDDLLEGAHHRNIRYVWKKEEEDFWRRLVNSAKTFCVFVPYVPVSGLHGKWAFTKSEYGPNVCQHITDPLESILTVLFRGVCGSGGRAGRPLIGRSEVWLPVHMSKCKLGQATELPKAVPSGCLCVSEY